MEKRVGNVKKVGVAERRQIGAVGHKEQRKNQENLHRSQAALASSFSFHLTVVLLLFPAPECRNYLSESLPSFSRHF